MSEKVRANLPNMNIITEKDEDEGDGDDDVLNFSAFRNAYADKKASLAARVENQINNSEMSIYEDDKSV